MGLGLGVGGEGISFPYATLDITTSLEGPSSLQRRKPVINRNVSLAYEGKERIIIKSKVRKEEKRYEYYIRCQRGIRHHVLTRLPTFLVLFSLPSIFLTLLHRLGQALINSTYGHGIYTKI